MQSGGRALAGWLRARPGLESPFNLITARERPGDCAGTPLPHVTAYLKKEDLIARLLSCVETHLGGK